MRAPGATRDGGGLGAAALAALMVPWTAYLFVVLPRTAPAAHFDLAWGGFDLALLVLLALTGWAAVRRCGGSAAVAGASAALLAADAWFDVVTAPTHGGAVGRARDGGAGRAPAGGGVRLAGRERAGPRGPAAGDRLGRGVADTRHRFGIPRGNRENARP